MTARDIVDAQLAELRANVGLLEPLRRVRLDEYLADEPRRKMVERCFQLAIESMIAVAHHLVGDSGWGHAASGEDALEILAARGALPRAYRDRIRGIAGFRNVLVHGYISLDHRIVHSHLGRLDDHLEFGRHVQAYLDRPKSG